MEARFMIIFLYGPDTYRSRQKLNEIIEHYKKIHKSGLNLVRLDMEKDYNPPTTSSHSSLRSERAPDFEDFKTETETISIFKEKKLIIIENSFSNQDFIEKFLSYKKDLPDDIILFFEEKTIDIRSPLFKFLRKNSKSQEFNFLEDSQLKIWIKKEFQKYNIEIEPKITQILIDFIGNNLWQLSNEIKKIITFKGKAKKIEEKDIDLLIKPKIEPDIFKTVDAISQKNKKIALTLIHQHLEKGDSPLYLLKMINFQFRNLLIIKDLIDKNLPYYSILKISRLHPFVVKKSFQQAQKFSLQELKKIYRKIFQVDLSIKTGKVNPETALDILIAEI